MEMMSLIKWILAIWIAIICAPFVLAVLGWAIWIILFIWFVAWIKGLMD